MTQWFVFSTQLVNCCPHGRMNYTCVLLPLNCTFSLTTSPLPPFPMYRARISRRLWSPGIDFEESISPAYVACRTGTANRVVVPAHQAANRFLGSLKGLKIRALYMQTVCDCGGGGAGGKLNCAVYQILQEFYTLFLTRFRTYKIATPPQTKMTSKDDIKGFVSVKFLRLWPPGSGSFLFLVKVLNGLKECWQNKIVIQIFRGKS